MTRSRAALVLAAGTVWAVAAWLLWRSSLPAYHLPQLDEHALFGTSVLHRAQHYSFVERLFFGFVRMHTGRRENGRVAIG